MRITFLSPVAAAGGAELVLLSLVNGLRTARPDWQLRVICGEAGALPARLSALGCDVEVLPLPSAVSHLGDAQLSLQPRSRSRTLAALSIQAAAGVGPMAVWAGRLRKALLGRCDLIHSNGIKMHIAAALAGPPGIPVVWHMHDYPGSRPVASRLLRVLRRRCSLAVAVSDDTARDVRKTLSVPVERIYNAVDLPAFDPSGPGTDLDAAAGAEPAPPSHVRVGQVGTFARWKGQDVFLRALAYLPKDFPVTAYIIGGPQYRTGGSQFTIEELRRKAESYGVLSRVRFTGFLADPASAMRSLDVVVHASTKPEPFGLVVTEAMAAGKAVIASAAGGVTELAVDGQEAVFFPPGDAEALAGWITQLARSPQRRAELGSAGRAAVTERFNSPRMIREFLSAYSRVVPRCAAAQVEEGDRVALRGAAATNSAACFLGGRGSAGEGSEPKEIVG